MRRRVMRHACRATLLAESASWWQWWADLGGQAASWEPRQREQVREVLSYLSEENKAAETKVTKLTQCEGEKNAAIPSAAVKLEASVQKQAVAEAHLNDLRSANEQLTIERDEARRIAEMLVEKGSTHNEKAKAVVRKKEEELENMAETVTQLRRELTAVRQADAQNSQYRPIQCRPSSIFPASGSTPNTSPEVTAENKRVTQNHQPRHEKDRPQPPMAFTDFGERLRLLRGYRAVEGPEARICMLCPKVIFSNEAYSKCCEFCFHEVLPQLSTPTVQMCRQEHELLLSDT